MFTLPLTFSTTNLALSASCWATCFISTASVNSLPKVRCVCRDEGRIEHRRQVERKKNKTKTKTRKRSGSYQRDVVEDEAEGGCSLIQIFTDLPGHELSLSDQLSCIKPGLDMRAHTHTHRLTLHIHMKHTHIVLDM